MRTPRQPRPSFFLASSVAVLTCAIAIAAGRPERISREPGWATGPHLLPAQRDLAGFDAGGMAQEIVNLTNQERERAGLSPLTVNEKLTTAAMKYAEVMRRADELGHSVKGQKLAARIAAVDYRWKAVGENVAYNYQLEATAVLNQWMHSSGHKANILNRTFTEIGVGVAGPSRSSRFYYSQMFGTPRARAAAAASSVPTWLPASPLHLTARIGTAQ